MGRIIKFSIIFGVVGIILIFILGNISKAGEGYIKESRKKFTLENLKSVLKDAEKFDDSNIKKIGDYQFLPGIDKNGELIGYVVDVTSEGFGGKIRFLLGLSKKGEVKGIKVYDSKNETIGLGSRINDEKWLEHWIGIDDTYDFNNGVDAFAGASVSPRAVFRGIKSASAALKNGEKKQETIVRNLKQNITMSNVNSKEKQQMLEKMKLVMKDVVDCSMNPIVMDYIKYYECLDGNGKRMGFMADLETDGYGDKIKMLLGINNEGIVSGLKVLEASGEKQDAYDLITNSKWQANWVGRNKSYEFDAAVDAIAGATISPTSVCDAVKKALVYCEQIKK